MYIFLLLFQLPRQLKHPWMMDERIIAIVLVCLHSVVITTPWGALFQEDRVRQDQQHNPTEEVSAQTCTQGSLYSMGTADRDNSYHERACK